MRSNITSQYYKDAVTGSSGDSYLSDFYKSMSMEYDRKVMSRDQRNNLYNSLEENNMTQIAHPTSVRVSDSIKDGGLVENGLEQHEKSVGVAKKNPTGNFVSNYAWMRKHMKKTGK